MFISETTGNLEVKREEPIEYSTIPPVPDDSMRFYQHLSERMIQQARASNNAKTIVVRSTAGATRGLGRFFNVSYRYYASDTSDTTIRPAPLSRWARPTTLEGIAATHADNGGILRVRSCVLGA